MDATLEAVNANAEPAHLHAVSGKQRGGGPALGSGS
jgi:hypothetical protein